jgi:hypothetical protein
MLSFEPRSLGENPGEVTELYRISLVGGHHSLMEKLVTSIPYGPTCNFPDLQFLAVKQLGKSASQ